MRLMIAAALPCLALPAAAAADTTVASSGGVFSSLTITGDSVAADNSNISVAPGTPGNVTVSDVVNLVDGDGAGGCAVTGMTATCPSPGTITASLGDGNDTITLQAGLESFFNTLSGDAGNDTLNGAEASDSLNGGPGNDTLNAGAGFDFLDGGAGSDVLNGGPGQDTASYAGRTNPVNLSPDGSADGGEAGENDQIANDIESLDGGDGDDTLTGTATADDPNAGVVRSLQGNAGNDTINGGVNGERIDGGDGNDTLNGNGGEDNLVAGDGNDVLDGGEGNDSLSADAGGADDLHGGADFDSTSYDEAGPGPAFSPLDVSISLDDQANDGSFGEGDDVHSDVENVTTARGNDTITGSSASNQLSGGPGNHTIDGGGGPDFLLGGLGDDRLLARNQVADLVDCGEGADSATTDDVDRISGCESNDAAAVPRPPGQTPGQTSPGPAARDTTPATLTLGGLSSKVKRSV